MSYDTTDYIHQMLNGSIVLYRGNPARISNISPSGSGVNGTRIHLNVYEDGHVSQDSVTWGSVVDGSAGLDIRSLSCKLGLANVEVAHIKCLIKITRLPRRQSTHGAQGLTSDNTCAVVVDDDANNSKYRSILSSGVTLSIYDLYKNKGFVDMINNNYPSIDEAVDMLNGGLDAVAINRMYYLLKLPWCPDPCVYRNETPIGVYKKSDKVFAAPKKYEWATESLSEKGVRVVSA